MSTERRLSTYMYCSLLSERDLAWTSIRIYCAENDTWWKVVDNAFVSETPLAIIPPTGTPSSTTYLRGDNSWATIAGGGDMLGANNLSDVTNAATARTNLSLGNVTNTSDTNKPVSTAQQTALDGKSATGHSHAGVYEPANANIQTHVAQAHAPSNAQANADITKAEIEAKLTGQISSHTHAPGAGGISMLKTIGDQTINAGAAVYVDVTGLTFPVVSGTDYAFDFYVVFQSASTATGHKCSVNCPAGVLDYFMTNQIVVNAAAGVATWTDRHSVTRDDMTLLATTISQAVDLVIMIKGRYKCTANGTFAVRFANELAANTQIVVQKGSWGTYF